MGGANAPIPPRNGEGDRPAQPGGGGVVRRSPFGAPRKSVEIARRERRSGNLPEVILWRALRTRPDGLRFRKQHPLDHYSLDFACLAARLAIEVDGEIHSRGDHPLRDAHRDVIVAEHGFATLRIPAKDVLNDLDAVLTAIVTACRDRLPLHHRAAPGGPPPRSGEVF